MSLDVLAYSSTGGYPHVCNNYHRNYN